MCMPNTAMSTHTHTLSPSLPLSPHLSILSTFRTAHAAGAVQIFASLRRSTAVAATTTVAPRPSSAAPTSEREGPEPEPASEGRNCLGSRGARIWGSSHRGLPFQDDGAFSRVQLAVLNLSLPPLRLRRARIAGMKGTKSLQYHREMDFFSVRPARQTS